MARKLLFLALSAAAAAYVISSRRRPRVGDPAGNGASTGSGDEVRRLVGGARGRPRAQASE